MIYRSIFLSAAHGKTEDKTQPISSGNTSPRGVLSPVVLVIMV
jgi:hypothetical protein